jgi:hypothetical protein
MVRSQIVCVDDLERAGMGLSTKDVLGLISYLKEQRRCKIVLLLNEEAFSDQDGAEFKTQLEKVADAVLRFEPSAYEAAEIGVNPSTNFCDWLKSDCIALGIVNIRVIKRIERIGKRLAEELKNFDRRILQQAIHSAALFIFCKYQPDSAPPLEFVKKFNPFDETIGNTKGDGSDSGWRALLRQFGWTHIDEFDSEILRVVEQGSVDSETLEYAARNQDRQLQLQDKDHSFSAAWDLYHDSFADNQDEVISALDEAIQKCAPAITPMNLSNTIIFLKEMGLTERAKQLVQLYVESRREPAKFWDLDNSPLQGEIKDPDVIAAFVKMRASLSAQLDPAEVLERIATNKGWDLEDVVLLEKLDDADFYQIFKSRRGSELRKVIYGALMFRNLGGATQQMEKITKNAETALRTIGAESRLNARRVKQFGIKMTGSSVVDNGFSSEPPEHQD